MDADYQYIRKYFFIFNIKGLLSKALCLSYVDIKKKLNNITLLRTDHQSLLIFINNRKSFC